MTNSKSHMGFRLTPISMTLGDLELHKFEFSLFSEFLGISRISDAIAVKRMKIGQYCQWQRCRHVELEQFWQAFASRGFVSDSWAFLLVPLIDRTHQPDLNKDGGRFQLPHIWNKTSHVTIWYATGVYLGQSMSFCRKLQIFYLICVFLYSF